jgi:hypothetical protein
MIVQRIDNNEAGFLAWGRDGHRKNNRWTILLYCMDSPANELIIAKAGIRVKLMKIYT